MCWNSPGTSTNCGCWAISSLEINCSELSGASTNNALEPFNNIIKKSYILNIRHTLSALVDIFMECLAFNISADIKGVKKVL